MDACPTSAAARSRGNPGLSNDGGACTSRLCYNSVGNPLMKELGKHDLVNQPLKTVNALNPNP